MRKRLSSRFTFLYKYIMPFVMLPAGLYLSFLFVTYSENKLLGIAISIVILFLIVLQARDFLKLKTVYYEEGKLFTKHGRKDIIVDFTLIESVKARELIFVKISLRSDLNIKTLVYMKKFSTIYSRLLQLNLDFTDDFEKDFKTNKGTS